MEVSQEVRTLLAIVKGSAVLLELYHWLYNSVEWLL